MDRNAIFVPSGDHAGSKSSWRLVVSRLRPEPFAFTTQTSSVPLENVILPVRTDTSIGDPIAAPAVEEEAGGGAGKKGVGGRPWGGGPPPQGSRNGPGPPTATSGRR